MGLLRAELMELMSIILNYNEPKLLMLGKQDIYTDVDDLKSLLVEYGFGLFDIAKCCNEDGVINAFAFFKNVGGVSECYALDYSDYEGADIIYNLNSDSEELPENLINKFDIIIDGGTLEHVFNPANAMRNINKMLKNNGTVYHMVPCAGLVNHGFYSFSPTFFLDYYGEKGYNIKTIRMQYKPERGIYKFVYYSMDCRLFLTPDGFNAYISKLWDKGGEIMLQCIAQKLDDNNIDNSPLQTRYKQIYGE